MRTRLIEYRVHPDRIEDNERLVRDVFTELAQARLAGVSYRVLKGEGGRFVHLVSGETAPSPITQLAAFQRFQAGIRERCAVAPVTDEMTVIGDYASPPDA